MIYNVGDLVYVPNAYNWRWEPCRTVINDIIEVDGEKRYYADCPHDNLAGRRHEIKEMCFREKELFDSIESCREYIFNFYYDGLCTGCNYENKCGNVWTCKDCEYCEKHISDSPTDKYSLICSKTNIEMGKQYGMPMEICKHYSPTLPQNIREYGSWEEYNDVLRNCEFNKECIFHMKSCHKTCTYEYYMNKYMKIPFDFIFRGRSVKAIYIRRQQWINQDFIDGNIIKCLAIDYAYEKNKRGLPKKECYPLNEHFQDITKIDIAKGEIIDE